MTSSAGHLLGPDWRFIIQATRSQRRVHRVVIGGLHYESAEMYMTAVTESAGRSSEVLIVMREGSI